MHSPTLIVPVPVGNRFANKVAPNVTNNIPTNPPFYYFASFLIVSLTHFINKPVSSRDLTIFVIQFIFSFEIINVFHFATSEGRVLDPKICL